MSASDGVTVSIDVEIEPDLVFEVFTTELDAWWGRGPRFRFLAPYEGTMTLEPASGPSAGTVPAVVDALALAQREFGTLSLAEVLAPAISLADGFAWYDFLTFYLKPELERIHRFPSGARVYLQGPGQGIPLVTRLGHKVVVGARSWPRRERCWWGSIRSTAPLRAADVRRQRFVTGW